MKETSEKVNEYTQCRTRTLFKETSTTISTIPEADQKVRQRDSYASSLLKMGIYCFWLTIDSNQVKKLGVESTQLYILIKIIVGFLLTQRHWGRTDGQMAVSRLTRLHIVAIHKDWFLL